MLTHVTVETEIFKREHSELFLSDSVLNKFLRRKLLGSDQTKMKDINRSIENNNNNDIQNNNHETNEDDQTEKDLQEASKALSDW